MVRQNTQKNDHLIDLNVAEYKAGLNSEFGAGALTAETLRDST